MSPTVYLAGPIMDCTFDEANEWRREVDVNLQAYGIVGISPLRCEPIIGDRYRLHDDPKFGTARAIGSKNLFDVQRCDMGIYYFPHDEERGISLGTVCEISWAFMLRRPTVLVSDDPKVLEHPVIGVNAGWIVNNLEDAVEICGGVLGGYAPGGKNV